MSEHKSKYLFLSGTMHTRPRWNMTISQVHVDRVPGQMSGASQLRVRDLDARVNSGFVVQVGPIVGAARELVHLRTRPRRKGQLQDAHHLRCDHNGAEMEHKLQRRNVPTRRKVDGNRRVDVECRSKEHCVLTPVADNQSAVSLC